MVDETPTDADEKFVAENIEKPSAQPPSQEPPVTPSVDAGSSDLIADLNTAVARMEAATKAANEVYVRNAQLKVQETLGGKSDAGKQSLTKDEKEKAEAKKMLVGTGFEDMLG